ncbi:MAG: MarR family winged helix-turn-helix transcriptional regulator [Candidatus Magasanikbacteria bacterium]
MNDIDIDKLTSLFFETGQMIREKVFLRGDMDPFSMAKIEAMKFIRRKEKPTMKKIANYFHIKPPSATSLVNDLKSAGYIKKMEDSKDRRKTRIQITSKGLDELNKRMKTIKSKMKKILSKLNEEEKNNFAKALKKILQKTKND